MELQTDQMLRSSDLLDTSRTRLNTQTFITPHIKGASNCVQEIKLLLWNVPGTGSKALCYGELACAVRGANAEGRGINAAALNRVVSRSSTAARQPSNKIQPFIR